MNTNELSLKPHPFFAGMSRQHLETLGQLASQRHFLAGDLIFREGQPADHFYLIANGGVDVITYAGGHPVTVQTLGAGDVLGWSWLFPPYRWHFEARAEKDTDAFSFPAAVLREKCETDPTLGYELMRRVSEVLMNRLQATRLKLVQAEKRAGS